MEEKWRINMRLRGIRITILSVFFTIISLVAISQTKKTAVPRQIAAKVFKKKKVTFRIEIPKNLPHIVIRYLIKGRNLNKNIKIKYSAENLSKDILRSQTLAPKMVAQDFQYTSAPIHLDNTGKIQIKNKIIDKDNRVKTWKIQLMTGTAEHRKLNKTFLFLEMLLWPSLSFLAMGVVMIIFPYIQ